MQDISVNDDAMELSEDAIKQQLTFLIRRYVSSQTKALAQAIVKQLELLLCHPNCIGYPDDRCGYKKMLLQWKALAN